MATYQEIAALMIQYGGSIHRSADLPVEVVDAAGPAGYCAVQDDIPLVWQPPEGMDIPGGPLLPAPEAEKEKDKPKASHTKAGPHPEDEDEEEDDPLPEDDEEAVKKAPAKAAAKGKR